MLCAIEDFLQTEIDEVMKNMYVLADSFTEEDDEDQVSCDFLMWSISICYLFQYVFEIFEIELYFKLCLHSYCTVVFNATLLYFCTTYMLPNDRN